MSLREIAYFALLAAGALAASIDQSMAQNSSAKPHVPLAKTIGEVTPTGPVPSLAVINSAGATLDGPGRQPQRRRGQPDRVRRPAGSGGQPRRHRAVHRPMGKKGSFANDPPNATISVLGGDGSKVSDAVVTLKSPKLEGSTLTFDVAVLEGSLSRRERAGRLVHRPVCGAFRRLSAAGGFIGGYGGFHGTAVGWHGGGYWHAPVYHGAWYGAGAGAAVGLAAGAAIGAAAAAPYYYPSYYGHCGYYPNPPC